MAEKDFVVKNGLSINAGVWNINTTAFYYNGTQFANSSFFSGQANTVNSSYIATISSNNASYLGGVAASAYVNTTGSYTLTGTLNFAGGFTAGSNVIANTSTLSVGNTTVNVSVNSTGFYVNGSILQGSGGYYKGNAGAAGETTAKQNLFRINANTQSNNITIDDGENALATGPLVIGSGYSLTIATGGRVVII